MTSTRLKGKKDDRVAIERLPIKFESDHRRVIARPFSVGGEKRIHSVVTRVAQLPEQDVEALLADVERDFHGRHHDMVAIFEENFASVAKLAELSTDISRARRLLIGSYFTMEYSIESAALFNPSIVPHPDQSNLPDGALRFIMSLRATGEGHISSIVFRTGVLESDHDVIMDPPGKTSRPVKQSPDRSYDREIFRRKLKEMGVDPAATDFVLNSLKERFTFAELEHAITAACESNPELVECQKAHESMTWLARSNYRVRVPEGAEASEMVIFPQTEAESRGIEDLRLVRFVEDDGSVTYFGTYTAYNGFHILPQLLETRDFHHVDIHTLNGRMVQNKGMALFPRKVGGHYVMCSRIDGENLYIMFSDYVHFWESAELLIEPKYPWELMQIGNCGSPIETEEGWILITHGVGPMRKYCIGAMLLDLEDPMKIIGHLRHPLLVPNEDERHGYVPNVVYSCGALKHHGRLYIPYAMSDSASSFAPVDVDELLEELVP